MTFCLKSGFNGIAPFLFGVLKRHAGIGTSRIVLHGATADQPANIECRRCGKTRKLPRLIDTRVFDSLAREFIDRHSRCKRPGVEAVKS